MIDISMFCFFRVCYKDVTPNGVIAGMLVWLENPITWACRRPKSNPLFIIYSPQIYALLCLFWPTIHCSVMLHLLAFMHSQSFLCSIKQYRAFDRWRNNGLGGGWVSMMGANLGVLRFANQGKKISKSLNKKTSY
jgi:hypothetical protein